MAIKDGDTSLINRAAEAFVRVYDVKLEQKDVTGDELIDNLRVIGVAAGTVDNVAFLKEMGIVDQKGKAVEHASTGSEEAPRVKKTIELFG